MADKDKTIENNTVAIAILKSNMDDIKKSVTDTSLEVKGLSGKIEALITTKIQETANIQVEIRLLSETVKRLERQSGLWKWLAPTLSSILAAAIVFLLTNYLQHLK